jgi:hypothetical protein
MAVYVPTQEEIAAACAEIRRDWPKLEHYRRQGFSVDDQSKSAARRTIHLTPELAIELEAS